MVKLHYRLVFMVLTVSFFFISIRADAQTGKVDAELEQREDSLAQLATKIVTEREPADRFRVDSSFTRMLVRALKIPHSFQYPFDSVKSISKLYAPDSAFRIFTWQVVRDESLHRRHGAIQVKTDDGSLKLFPLIDRSFLIGNAADTVTSHERWLGSIYYRIVLKTYNNKKFLYAAGL